MAGVTNSTSSKGLAHRGVKTFARIARSVAVASEEPYQASQSPTNQGCCNASRAVILREGSMQVILQMRSLN